MNSFTAFLLDVNTTISANGGAAQSASQPAPSGGLFGSMNPVMLIVIYCVALILIMYFLSVRPTQKREKALAEQRKAIEVGDMVVTNSGMYGKVVDITYECFIIEFGLNKGVNVPVAKGEVFGKREPNLSNEAPPQLEEKPKKKGLFRKG